MDWRGLLHGLTTVTARALRTAPVALGALGAWIGDGPLFEIREAGKGSGSLRFYPISGRMSFTAPACAVGRGDGQWPG